MGSAYLHHVTLNSVHVARQPRDVVSDDAVAPVQSMLDSALTGGCPKVVDGCTLTTANEGSQNLIATVWGPPMPEEPRGAPLVTIGVARKSRSALRLWQVLHSVENVPLATDPLSPPSAPWIAARIEPAALLHPAAMPWAGDFQRCLGWAWMEREQ